MKKLLSFIVLLLCFLSFTQVRADVAIGSVGTSYTQAQLNALADGVYSVALYNKGRNTYFLQSGTTVGVSSTAPTATSSMNYVYYLIKSGTTYKFLSNNGSYITSGSGSGSSIKTSSSYSSAANFSFVAGTVAGTLSFKDTSSNLWLNGNQSSTAWYSSTGSNSNYLVYPVTLTGTDGKVLIGSICTDLSGQYDLSNYTLNWMAPADNVTAPTISNYTYTSGTTTGFTSTKLDNVLKYDLTAKPFATSTFDAAATAWPSTGMKWYTMQLRSKYSCYDAANSYSSNNSTLYANLGELWCFTGDGATGYKIYNYLAGPQKILWAAARTADSHDPILMTAVASANDGHQGWVLLNNGGSYYMFKEGAGTLNMINDVDSRLGEWYNSAASSDDGSKFIFTESSLITHTYSFQDGDGNTLAGLGVSLDGGLAISSTGITIPAGATLNITLFGANSASYTLTGGYLDGSTTLSSVAELKTALSTASHSVVFVCTANTAAISATDDEGNALVSGKLYRINLPGRDNTPVLTQNSDNFNPTTSYTYSNTQAWKISGNGSNVVISTPANGYWKINKYAAVAGTVLETGTNTTATPWTVEAVTITGKTNTYNLTNTFGTTKWYLSNNGGGTANMGFYNVANDGGSYFTFTPLYSVNYKCVDQAGVVLQQNEYGYLAKNDVPAIAGYTFVSKSAEIADDATVTFTYKFTTNPITASAAPSGSFDASTTWYVMTQSGNYLKYTTDGLSTSGTSLSYPIADEYLWCFVGSESTGYKWYNKAAGTAVWAGPAETTITSGSTRVKMKTASTYNQWSIVWKSDGVFKMATTGSTTYYLDRASGFSVLFAGSNGGANAITFTKAMDLYASMMTQYKGSAGCVGGYSAEIVNTAFATTPANVDEFNTAFTSLRSNALITFDANKCYRLKNVGKSNYLSSDGTNVTIVTNANYAANNLALLWKFVNKSGTNCNVMNAANNKYIGTIVTSTVIPMSTTAVTVDLANNVTTDAAVYVIKKQGTAYSATTCIHNAGDNTAVGWEASGNPNSRWYLMPATELDITPHAVGSVTDGSVYNTYHNATGFNLTLPTGLTANYVTSSGSAGTYVTTTATTKIESGMSVILNGTIGTTYTCTPSAAANTITDNVLKYADAAVAGTTTNNIYIFGYLGTETTPKFFKVEDTSVQAGKVYLESAVNSGVKQLDINFGGLTTGVSSVEAGSQTTPVYYDLQGRRVANPTKGVFISNGKKVIIK